MKGKTKGKVTFNIGAVGQKTEQLFADIMRVTIDEKSNISAFGEFYYDNAGERVFYDNFAININEQQATDILGKTFLDSIQDAFADLALAQLTEKFGVAKKDLDKSNAKKVK